ARVRPKEAPVRPPGFSPSQLPLEWLNAIRGVEEPTVPERNVSTTPLGPLNHEPSESYEHASELRTLIGRLKQERIDKGLSLGDVAKRTQQARSALSRLESGEYENPTLHTLYRYARALGWNIRFCAEPIRDHPRPETASARGRRK